tara:strand:+ start:1050 stop:1922 length:873 start_codon:yes stop_codon:yes gene_type:complete
MALNSYFNQTSTVSEQNVVDSLVTESIQITGQNFYYLKRTDVNVDSILNESTITSFNSATLIEMYIEDAQGFEGEGDFLSKFGLEVRDTLNVLVSKSRFTTETSMTIPLAGDLLYFPLVDRCFEIKFVEDEVPFYQLGKNYVYKLSTELFEFSQENFNTGVAEIDDIVSDSNYTTVYSIDITLGTGSGDYSSGESVYQGTNFESATATATVESWNSGTKTLRVTNLSGSFAQNVATVGVTSGANYLLGATNTYTYVQETTQSVDNSTISSEAVADDVIDFSVTNPFSEKY